MYPFLRLAHQFLATRNLPDLGVDGTHVSTHRCWPWDLDGFLEMNNGRILTIYDLGRLPLGRRTGLLSVLRRERWGLTMAGASVRYRARLRAFQTFEMHSRLIGWDEKFMYIEQSMWRGQTCCSHILYRAAVTDRAGIVPVARVMAAMGIAPEKMVLPDWAEAWIRAEALRPWPPARDGEVSIAKAA